MRIERIVFLQGHTATEALNLRDKHGDHVLKTHLIQWHNPGKHETSPGLGHGSLDDVTFFPDGYVVSYNMRLGYCGLEYVLES